MWAARVHLLTENRAEMDEARQKGEPYFEAVCDLSYTVGISFSVDLERLTPTIVETPTRFVYARYSWDPVREHWYEVTFYPSLYHQQKGE